VLTTFAVIILRGTRQITQMNTLLGVRGSAVSLTSSSLTLEVTRLLETCCEEEGKTQVSAAAGTTPLQATDAEVDDTKTSSSSSSSTALTSLRR
jgi:hypothetical protein